MIFRIIVLISGGIAEDCSEKNLARVIPRAVHIRAIESIENILKLYSNLHGYRFIYPFHLCIV